MSDERLSLVVEKLFSIQTKEGVKVPFILNPAQRFFTQNRSDRTLVAKARQKGFSSYILAEFSVRCLGYTGTHAVVMSHEGQATQRLLDKASYYLRHIKGPPPKFGRHSRNEFYFEKMESSFYIGTAGSKAFGRGDFVTDLHCSEYAWWEDPGKHHAGIFQAVPKTGRITIESTGNGRANDFYFLWVNAEKMGYTRLFYPWYADDEYVLNHIISWTPTTPGWNGHLKEIQQKLGVSDQKMAWYEWKFRELREDIKMMNQEYPTEPEDCFQATGGALFPNVRMEKSSDWITDEKKFGFYMNYLRGHPCGGFMYIMGCDPSGGTGNDDAALQIFCCQTGELVLSLANDQIQPIRFGELICQLGSLYNDAFVVPEGNNHGIAVVEYLKNHYKRYRIYKRKLGTATTPPLYGWLNNQQNKHSLIDTMQNGLNDLIIYDAKTISELMAFEEIEEGKFQGKSDNLVIATGLALIGLEKYSHLRGSHIPVPEEVVETPPKIWSYDFDDMMSRLKKRSDVNYFGEMSKRIH